MCSKTPSCPRCQPGSSRKTIRSSQLNKAATTGTLQSLTCSSCLQQDTFLPMLSAWESLDIYIQLSLPLKLNKADRHARMDAVLESMGLLRSKHTKVRL